MIVQVERLVDARDQPAHCMRASPALYGLETAAENNKISNRKHKQPRRRECVLATATVLQQSVSTHAADGCIGYRDRFVVATPEHMIYYAFHAALARAG